MCTSRICPSDYCLDCELKHLKKVFHEQNDYPIWVINKVFKEFQRKQNEITTSIATAGNEERNDNVKNHLFLALLHFRAHDIVYYAKCPEESCPHDYVAGSGRRVLERVKDHNGRETSSHIFKYCVVSS